jgi:anaerobic ribonucleoside-triphosphate reductase
MGMLGYRCNACGNGFEEVDTKPDIVCIECGSDDIEQSDKVSEFLELIREMGWTGG